MPQTSVSQHLVSRVQWPIAGLLVPGMAAVSSMWIPAAWRVCMQLVLVTASSSTDANDWCTTHTCMYVAIGQLPSYPETEHPRPHYIHLITYLWYLYMWYIYINCKSFVIILSVHLILPTTVTSIMAACSIGHIDVLCWALVSILYHRHLADEVFNGDHLI